MPAALVTCLGLGVVFSPFSRLFRRLLLATILAYGSASGLASARVAMQTDRRHLPKLPAAFAAMHLSYGAGFLMGNGAIGIRRLARTVSE